MLLRKAIISSSKYHSNLAVKNHVKIYLGDCMEAQLLLCRSEVPLLHTEFAEGLIYAEPLTKDSAYPPPAGSICLRLLNLLPRIPNNNGRIPKPIMIPENLIVNYVEESEITYMMHFTSCSNEDNTF